jgi:isopenicillin-N N-acyltransferase-like protein
MSKIKIQAKNPFLPIYEVEGKGHELGLQIGKLCKEQIQKTINTSNNWFMERKNRDQNQPDFLNENLIITKQNFPQYIEEIRGYADGADVDFRDIWILNSADYFSEDKCSDIILKSKNKIIQAHNEDFNSYNSQNSYFLHIGGQKSEILAHTYPGVIPGFSFAMNSHGISVTCNSIPNTDRNQGVSRKIIDRWALESTSLEQFIDRITFKPRSGVFSYNLASSIEFKAFNIESTEEEIQISNPDDSDGFLQHTNHYICEKWKSRNKIKDPSTTSFNRYDRLLQIVPQSDNNIESALNIISDDRVLTHENEIFPGWYGLSFCSVIFEITSNGTKMVTWPYSRDSSAIVQAEVLKGD